MWQSIARDREQLDPQCSGTPHCAAMFRYTTTPISLYPVARKLLLISRPAKVRRLSWPQHTLGQQLAQSCFQMNRLLLVHISQVVSHSSYTTPTTTMYQVICLIYASAAARWRGDAYMFYRCFFCFFFCFFPCATIVHKYETTILGNG